MKNKKVLIVIICILIIMITVIWIFINKLKENKKEEEIIIQENPKLTTNMNIIELESQNEFFTVENCVNEFLSTLASKNSEAIYSLLSNTYANQNSITNSNVLGNVNILKNGFEEFFVKDIYYKEISYDKEYQYYIYGQILGENYNTIQTVYIIANLDFENMAFNVAFSENIEVNYEEYLNIIENLKKGNTNEIIYIENQANNVGIELNSYNGFKDYVSQNPYALDKYLKNYSIMAVYYPDIAFSLLDDEYRTKRFENIDDYKQYVMNNQYNILNSTIAKYSISEKDGYYQYTIMDTNENYYIFNVRDIMEYTLISDIYTIDLDEITSKYDESNVQERVAINIQKVVSALNNKDYKYVYSKLAEEFKTNKYPTLEQFKNYISKVIIGNPQISFGEFRNEGETYIYNITLESARASAGDPVNMQIIMKLEENRDFVMSFNIK